MVNLVVRHERGFDYFGGAKDSILDDRHGISAWDAIACMNAEAHQAMNAETIKREKKSTMPIGAMLKLLLSTFKEMGKGLAWSQTAFRGILTG